MMRFRVTVRYGQPQQYAVRDVEARSLAEAMQLAAQNVSEAAEPDADLVEIRVQMEPESRDYVEE